LTEKCFPFTNFHNGKQTQKSLESGFPKTTFRKTNTPVILERKRWLFPCKKKHKRKLNQITVLDPPEAGLNAF
jgi:hypothetical protein